VSADLPYGVIDVLGGQVALGELLEQAEPGGTISLARLSQVAVGKADRRTVEQQGEHWLRTLIATAELGGVGRLVRDRGGVVFRFVEDLPSVDQAVLRALDAT
jgi:hypothetical protein